MPPQRSKSDVLQAFLDTSNWALQMFDIIEADAEIPYRKVINETNRIISALAKARDALVAEYVLSGGASDDFLAMVRRSLGGGDEHA